MPESITMRVVLAPGRVLCAVDAHGMPLARYVGFFDAGKTPMPEGELVAAEPGPDGKPCPTHPLYAGAFAAGSLLALPGPAPTTASETPSDAPAAGEQVQ